VRIALFATCLGDTLFPGAAIATVRVLERLGHSVEFPQEQTCCGQMHANSGYDAQATGLLRRFVETFASERFDAIVAPSGSCAAMVKDQYPRLVASSGDDQLRRSRRAHPARVRAVATACQRAWDRGRALSNDVPLIAELEFSQAV
jgi:L-lactate dehydrogenase complex protein LldE